MIACGHLYKTSNISFLIDITILKSKQLNTSIMVTFYRYDRIVTSFEY